MAVTKQQKADKVTQIAAKLKQYPVVAVATLQSLPTRNFNAVKKSLRGKAELIVARKTLLIKAIDAARPELKPLAGQFEGSPAILVSSLPPFQLYAAVKQGRSKAFAKAGQTAPYDLVIPAGETDLAPGPVLTELKQAGLSAKIKGPKVVIEKDAVVAKKGEAISESAAKVLAKLNIQPMEVGLSVIAAFENGTVYPAGILDVDAEGFKQQLMDAHRAALNLAVNACIFNAVSTPLIIAKAAGEATALEAFIKSKQPAAPAQEAPAAEAVPANTG